MSDPVRQGLHARLKHWGLSILGTSSAALAVTAAPAAESTAPLNYFLHAAGPASAPTLLLGWVFTAICVGVCLIIAVLLAIAILRPRPPVLPDNVGALAATQGGINWIYIGVGVSTVVLIAMLVYALITLERVAAPNDPPTLTITVTAYDWWWKVAYDDAPDSSQRFVTANEIHIPVGEPVRVKLDSADVIHAFWVPTLAGKTQTIPGQTNEQWIQADHPGVYRGQCSQFCGAQHAHMAFEVIAQNRADFAAWSAQQAKPHASTSSPTSMASSSVAAGQKLFEERCAGCHTVRGSLAVGAQAPDLTHLDSRRLIAAGMLPNTAANQLDWITHAQQIKPESMMPSMILSRDEATDLSAFLATLQ
ncbi:Cytochrome c oxidase subunit 2 (plasmid) [Caballeronia sp. SBC1]|uniref:cytochrome c oxidase subunit II n=1 Tax=Caballeronia sp. SBC1 TaxID=2705548 RepID=UPI001407B1DA|nr:cytochrome c oxidase subunit II [Caballeronia sp. SBC1]QIN67417.1 Cytochrome c oxidase subunit 2 [Caballeronia sp. SBC1]